MQHPLLRGKYMNLSYVGPIGHASLVCAILIFYYFPIFIHVPVANNDDELCVLSHTGVISTFVSPHLTKLI